MPQTTRGPGSISSNVSRKVRNPIFNREGTTFKCCQLIYRECLNRIRSYTNFGFYVSKFQPLFSFLKTLVNDSSKQEFVAQDSIFNHKQAQSWPHKRCGTQLEPSRASAIVHVGATLSCLEGPVSTWWLQSSRKFNIFHLLIMSFVFVLTVSVLLLHGNLKNLIIASYF